MLKKIFLKFINHFLHPINSIFFDFRKLYWLYAKFYLIRLKKINFPKTDFLIYPDYADLLNLWKHIIKRKPKVIIEVGSGQSTFLILAAINYLSKKKFLVKKFYSLEQNKKYLMNLKKNLNIYQLKRVSFILTNLKTYKIKNTRVTICKNFPNDKINFFYEDRLDHSKYKIAGDALKIETKMPKDFFICVDGMKSTVDFYKKNLTRKYKVSGGFLFGSNFEPFN